MLKSLKGTRQNLLTLQQNYEDIVSKHSSDIGLTHLEEMTIDTGPKFAPCHDKTISITFKIPQVKEEIEHLLEAGLVERFMCPLAGSIIVVPRISKPGAPLAETKRLVIDCCELNKQIPQVPTQAKSKRQFSFDRNS